VSGVLAAHDGQHGFGHRDGAEEIGLKLAAEFLQPNVFRKSCHGESGIVDQDVQTATVADNRVNEGGKGLEVGDVERTDI